MDWILMNIDMILGILLAVSEISAAIVQMTRPQNEGISGIIAALVKLLQKLGAKNLG